MFKVITSVSRTYNGHYVRISMRNLSSDSHRKNSDEFDVFIVGGGTTGTALYYTLSQFTDIKRIALCERRSSYALVASYPKNNSQTIHCGDIETNYTIESARKVKRAADLLRNYLTKLQPDTLHSIAREGQKMVIGVGDVECDFIEKRFAPFKEIFPSLEYLTKEQVAAVEPNVIYRGDGSTRPEDVNALFVKNELTTINYMLLSETFVKTADSTNKDLVPMLNTEVKKVVKEGNRYKITTNNGTFYSSFVVFATCGYSLLFAHRMKIGLEYSVLPVAGSFYFSKDILRGKVYTVQNPQLPFAAIHGDPDIVAENQTRFGPTALPLPLLERYNLSSFPDFLRVFKLDFNVLAVYFNLFKQSTIRNYVLRNFLFEVPLLSRWLFVKDARKIVPSLKFGDVKYSVGYGGVRPQLVDKKNRKLLFGESKIRSGDGLIFNITASPGATTCLANSEIDMREICEYLGANVKEDKLRKTLYEGSYAIKV
ncbi:malate:quinone oxidoreductase, putative [Theileria equi strain WA]|uniref:Malate:quinone oxidoreductase, putative n=1 Tax=Theileria equi strain WA TaxID=1537102 RepID=L1LCT7_THEEQ|nr:malate:quinone oxidoreductase, putative [Theileria equi strain WA]EKX73156.1 malate:quinone oxidoreductase, putative [Theileria equi strain WA]|eukprot:XP_004832608.1 malate:quinone oxidoreductase, putative [Theileria equi strain WA]